VSQMATEMEDKRVKLGEATGFYKEKQGELQTDGDQIAKAKTKLAGVTRTKEYAAMQRELDNLRKKYAADEGELLRLAEAMQEYEVSIAAEETKLVELRAEVEREEAASGDQLKELDERISSISAKKLDAEGRLDRTLLTRYARLLQRREGMAVVPVGPKGKCTGCQRLLPPQQYIQVQRGERLLSCPNCQRYLHHAGEAPTDETETAAAAASE
jgi:predicted  nucleic acid-binding Zn-ribbon protein